MAEILNEYKWMLAGTLFNAAAALVTVFIVMLQNRNRRESSKIEREESKNELQRLMQDVLKDDRAKNDRLEARLDRMNAEQLEMFKKLSGYEISLTKGRSEADELIQTVGSLREMHAKDLEIYQLKLERAEAQYAAEVHRSESLQSRIDVMEVNFQKLSERLTELEKSLDVSNKARAAAENERDSLLQRLDEQSRTIAALQAQLTEANECASNQQKIIETLKLQLEELRDARAGSVVDVQG